MTQRPRSSFKRKLRVCYPAGTGTLVIRTDLDWERDIHPVTLSGDGNTATFEIEAQQPFVYFKPCLIKSGSLHWAIGPNDLLVMASQDGRVGRHHRRRCCLPLGYEENTLARYPLAYMQDGQNVTLMA